MNTLNRRQFLGATASLLGAAAQRKRRPNVIFMLTDDQGRDSLGCYGNKVLTPNVDRIAREGVLFNNAYVSTAVCTPSRYTCLTGRYASRCMSPNFLNPNPLGTQSNIGWNTAIEAGGWNVGRALKTGGYATGVVGKWHVAGPIPGIQKYSPDADMADPAIDRILAKNQELLCDSVRARGFDYASCMYSGNLDDYHLKALNAHNMEWVVKGGLDFIDKYREQPFFLYFSTTVPHSPNPRLSLTADPRITPAGLLKTIPDVMPPRASVIPRAAAAGVPESMAAYTWLDDGVGAILRRLEKYDLINDTVIFYFGDNGPVPGKGTCYQLGVHQPCVMRWPSRLPAGTKSDVLVQNIDFVPTVLEICGVTPPPEMLIDGKSILPVLADPGKAWRDALYFEIGHTRAVLAGNWKYIALRYPPDLQKKINDGTLGRPGYHVDAALDLQKKSVEAYPAYFDADQLYDVRNDPDERKNLSADPRYAQRLAELKLKLKAWLATFPDRPFGEFAAG